MSRAPRWPTCWRWPQSGYLTRIARRSLRARLDALLTGSLATGLTLNKQSTAAEQGIDVP